MAIKEGSVVFPKEPLLVIAGPLAGLKNLSFLYVLLYILYILKTSIILHVLVTQLMETTLLTLVNYARYRTS